MMPGGRRLIQPPVEPRFAGAGLTEFLTPGQFLEPLTTALVKRSERATAKGCNGFCCTLGCMR